MKYMRKVQFSSNADTINQDGLFLFHTYIINTLSPKLWDCKQPHSTGKLPARFGMIFEFEISILSSILPRIFVAVQRLNTFERMMIIVKKLPGGQRKERENIQKPIQKNNQHTF